MGHRVVSLSTVVNAQEKMAHSGYVFFLTISFAKRRLSWREMPLWLSQT